MGFDFLSTLILSMLLNLWTIHGRSWNFIICFLMKNKHIHIFFLFSRRPVIVELCPFFRTWNIVICIRYLRKHWSFIFGRLISIDKWITEAEKQITCLTNLGLTLCNEMTHLGVNVFVRHSVLQTQISSF